MQMDLGWSLRHPGGAERSSKHSHQQGQPGYLSGRWAMSPSPSEPPCETVSRFLLGQGCKAEAQENLPWQSWK